MTIVKHGVRSDQHSLHDLRVAIRRLRAWLDAYRFSLQDTLPKGIRKKLHRIQASTNAARDLEVQYLWLQDHAPKHAKGKDRRQQRLVRTFRRRYRKGLRHVDAAVQQQLPRIARRLDKALAYYCVSVDSEPQHDFSMALATIHALSTSAEGLHHCASRVTSVEDMGDIHHTRVAAKRLRYLLEPLRDSYQTARRAIEHLTALQDTMGELRDASVLQSQLPRSGRSPFSQQAHQRVHAARAQYASTDAGTVVEQILSDVSNVVILLHAVAAEPLYHDAASLADDRHRQLRKNEHHDNHFE